MLNLINNKYEVVVNKFVEYDNSDYFTSIGFFKYNQQTKDDFYFQLIELNTKKVKGVVSFYFNKNGYISPIKGTYGGFDFEKSLSYEIIENFIKFTIDFLVAKGAKKIIIKMQPFCYSQAISSVKINILLNLGFQIMHSDLNYHCFVDNNDYLNLINYSAKKRINKCLRDGYISKTYNLEEWPKVYNLLRESRSRRGYEISMNNNEFEDHIRNFSKYTKIFGVEKNKDLVAGSVCIRNNLNSLYVSIGEKEKINQTLVQLLYLH